MASGLLAAGLLAGCSSGGGGSFSPGADPIDGALVESATPSGDDLVRLAEESVDGEFVTIAVTLGPTTSAEVFSVAFALAIQDTSVARYLEGSHVEGAALGTSVSALASQQGDRVFVGITREGSGVGAQVVGPGAATLVSLTFELLREGATEIRVDDVEPSAALDPRGNTIPSISFDFLPASLVGS